jgi:integrase
MPADLSAKQVTALGPGRHRVATNLYLLIDETRRSWVLRYVSPVTGKLRDMGLGPADLVPLARARDTALRHRIALFEGRDPLDERQGAKRAKQPPAMTFRQVAKMYLDAHRDTWRNAKHKAQWQSTLETYAYPELGDTAIKAVDTAAVMAVLEPIWHAKPETASRVRGRIETIISYATARHWRSGENPARWKGHIENLLPRPGKVKPATHHAAIPWRDLPTLWADLACRDDISALALRFCLLTATRTNEVLGATWDEIDRIAKVWSVPGSRMKTGKEHQVPLSAAALVVLDKLAGLRQGEYLFPGAKAARPLSNMSMLMALRRLRGMGVTVHGMRSGFRDWASETGVASEVAELALAHTIRNKVEAAYRRGNLLQPRAIVMENWARFLMTPKTETKVVPLRTAG